MCRAFGSVVNLMRIIGDILLDERFLLCGTTTGHAFSVPGVIAIASVLVGNTYSLPSGVSVLFAALSGRWVLFASFWYGTLIPWSSGRRGLIPALSGNCKREFPPHLLLLSTLRHEMSTK